jgi:hypothetical protein
MINFINKHASIRIALRAGSVLASFMMLYVVSYIILLGGP